MKFNLKENLPLSMNTYNEIYNWYVETSAITFLEKELCSSFSFAYFLIKVFQKRRLEVFCKTGVHRNFAKFTGKRLCLSLLFNKTADWPTTLLKKRLWHRCFPVNFSKFLRRGFLRTPPVAASRHGTTKKNKIEIIIQT